jgi:LysM repeat protein
MSRTTVARVGAPLAFLLAATLGVLAVRAAVDGQEPVRTILPTATAPATTGDEPREVATARPDEEPEFYVIEAGDTLEAIASAHGTTVEQLLLLNPNIDPVALTIGQRIRVG